MSNKDGSKKAGRPKGSVNKTTALLKDAIIKAAARAGKQIDPKEQDGLVTYLQEQAILNPGPFMGLLGKVLPMQVSGANDGPLQIEIVRYSDDN